MRINRIPSHAAGSSASASSLSLGAAPAYRYPDSRVLESQLARLPITYPPDGQLQIASVYLEIPPVSPSGGPPSQCSKSRPILAEYHVVYVAGQEDAATNAIGQWWASVTLDLTTAAAQELVKQVRLAERGRKIREEKAAAEREAAERAAAVERRKKTNSDSIFRKYQGDQQGDQ